VRLICEQKMGPAIFVLLDWFTALGGNQYLGGLNERLAA